MFSKREAQTYERAGRPLRCQICGHDRFFRREAQLNTKGATVLGFDWANPSGDCYICERCRHIIWFYGESENP